MADSQTLTSGADIVDFGSSSGNTVTATDGTLTAGDQINAGTGPNTLVLSGPGTFDLTAPTSLAGISTVEEDDPNQTVLLRAGLPVTVTVSGTVASNEDVTLANIGDGFQGGASGSNTIRATAAQISQDTIDGGSGYYSTLVVTDSGGTATLTNVSDIAFVSLTGDNTTLDPSTSGVPNVWLKSTGDTVTLNAATNYAIDYVGGNTIQFTAAGDSLFIMPAAPAPDTLTGFDSNDFVQIDNMSSASAAAASVSFDPSLATVTVTGSDGSGNAVTDVFQLQGGTYTDNFILVPTSTGYTLTYGPDPSKAFLTTSDDTVSSGVSLVVATDGTLTGGDNINPDPGSTLDLVGAGTFDLGAPASLSGITTLDEYGSQETVTTLAGLPLTVTDFGDNDVTTLQDPGDQFIDKGTDNTVAVTAAELSSATITGSGSTTLDLLGSGTFDLSQANLSGVTTVVVEDAGATVIARSGMPVTFTLVSGNDTVTLANDGDSVAGGTSGQNTIILNDASRYATVDPGTGGGNQLDFVGQLFNAQNPQTSFQTQAFSANGTQNFQSAGIAGVGATLDPGYDYLTTLYTNSTGTTVILDPVDPLLVDANTGTNVFFGDSSKGTETLSLPTAGSAPGGSENLYNFAPNDVIALGDFADDQTALATYDASAGTVVVTGDDASGNPLSFTFNLNGNAGGGGYDSTAFQIVPDTTDLAPNGVDLIYTGAPSTVPVLTTTTDNVGSLAAGTPIIAGPDSLSNGDAIAGNDSEVQLVGAGTFDFSQPATLSGITDVAVNGQNQDVFSRQNTGLTFLVNGSFDQVHLQSTTATTDNADTVIVGTDDSALTVYATAAEAATATIQGTAGGDTTLQIDTFYQNGQYVTLGAGISDIQHINLANNGVIFDTAAYLTPLQVSINIGYGTPVSDTVILRGAGDELTDFTNSSASNTVDLDNQNQVVDIWSDGTGSSETINGLDSTDTLHLWFVEPGATLAVKHSSDNTETVATVTGTDYSGVKSQFVFNFSGDLTGAFTLGTPNEQGVDLEYAGPAAPGIAFLTTASDTVSSGVSTVVATDNTLSPDDVINPDAGSTLDLFGAGTFDLTQPASLSNIAAIQVGSANANVTLRSGLTAPVTLSSGGNDTVTLADSTDVVNANGGQSDVFNVTADQAANATIAGGAYATLNVTASDQWVTIGQNVTGIDYLGLLGTNDSLDPGNSGASLIYVYGGYGGGNTTVLNGTTKSAIDYASSTDSPDNYFFSPGNGDALTIEYANAPEQNLYGFDSTSQVVLAGFASASVSATDDSAIVGAPATLVTVTGTDSLGNTISQQLQLYGAYSNNFSVNPITGSGGYVLTYGGTAPNNTLTASTDTITGVSDVYAATGTINGGDSITTTPGGTLHLIGAGSFYINSGAAISGISTIIGQGPQQSITLIPNAAVTLDIASGDGHDVIWNATDESVINGGSTGNNYAATTFDQVNGLNVDLGSGLNNLVQINGDSYSLTLNAPGITHVTSFSIEVDGGITLDTGRFDAATGYGVNINIGVSAGATVRADTVVLRGTDETVSDFAGGNNLSLLAEGQIIWADMDGQGTPADTVTGFDQTDTIDLNSLTGASITQTINTTADTTTVAITGTQSSHAYSQDFVLTGIYDGTFTAAPSSDGTAITYVSCYAEGTRIAVLGADAAPRDVAIESLREGDVALLHGGGTRPIVWIGSRRIDVTRHPDPDSVSPIRIAAGAIAPGQPCRDLTVSPDHAVMVDGTLIPARMLLNGASVRRLDVPAVHYFHVELDAHDVLLAEGLPAESYLDTGNRATFLGNEVVTLHPDLTPTPRTPRMAGLPVAIDEATVRPAWVRLAARAGLDTADTATQAMPDAPVLIVQGAVVRPIGLASNRIGFVLPPRARSARLVSTTTRPTDARPWLDDRRRLGVAVARLEADGTVLPLDGPDLRAGWHAPERDGTRLWRWTDGDATIELPRDATLLTIALVDACRLPMPDERAAA